MSIIQYLMLKDKNDAYWRNLRATDCRVGALAYGQHAYIEADRMAWAAVSPEDRTRLCNIYCGRPL